MEENNQNNSNPNPIPSETAQPVSNAQTPPPPSVPKGPRISKTKIVILIIVILLSSVGGILIWLNASPRNIPSDITPANRNLKPSQSPGSPSIKPSSIIHSSSVDWLSEPEKVNDVHPLAILDKYIFFKFQYYSADGKDPTLFLTASYEKNATYYKVGTLTSVYPGATLYLALIKNLPRGTTLKGINTINTIVHDKNIAMLFVKDKDSFILTGDYIGSSSFAINPDDFRKIPDGELVYSDLILDPLKYTKVLSEGKVKFFTNLETYDIDFNNSKMTLKHPINFFTQGTLTKVYDFQDGHVLYSNQNLSSGSDTVNHVFFPELNLRLPTNLWTNAFQNISLRPNSNPADPNFEGDHITWNPGMEPPDTDPPVIAPNVVNQYSVKGYTNSFGCLMFYKDKFTQALAETINTSDLKPIGKTDQGGTLYDIKNKNLTIFKSTFDYEFNSSFSIKQNITLEKYISYKPILIYKELTGEYEAVFREDTLPQRCYGEPLIYLYPEQKTNINVALSPNISLTESAPLYKNGWNVIADPTGLITDPKTNLFYHHLYWEGNVAGKINPVSDEVIAQKNIHSYFEKSLKILGLNSQETKDFEQYWEPKLSNSSYYRIIFYDAKELNNQIPLYIKPKPDTQIRILMDNYPLTGYQASERPLGSYSAANRSGFTLVEWGGILK